MDTKESEVKKPRYDNDKAEHVIYPDGSINDEISSPGAVVDLAGRENANKFDLRKNAGTKLGITLSDYDGTKFNYIFTESGFGPTVLFTTPKDAEKSSYQIIDELPIDFVHQLHADPLTVKSRGNIFGRDLKVEKISTYLGTYDQAATTDKANPITAALHILRERSKSK